MGPSCTVRLRAREAALLLLLSACTNSAASTPYPEILRDIRQLLLVVTPAWTSRNGVLTAFERDEDGTTWRQHGKEVAVVVGQNGLGWGRGLSRVDDFSGPVKKEGDQRAPAGIFRLSSAFGYAPTDEARQIKLPYVALTSQSEAIDDPDSRYYNQLVDRSEIPTPDWRSSEQMRRDDDLYRWGIVVDHNTSAVPNAGSCIFLHIWRSPTSTTNGCTAMAEPNLRSLLAWLDPKANPVLIQLPLEELERLRACWNLP
jgi:D-alanyl-D-alanine dipeptidase